MSYCNLTCLAKNCDKSGREEEGRFSAGRKVEVSSNVKCVIVSGKLPLANRGLSVNVFSEIGPHFSYNLNLNFQK